MAGDSQHTGWTYFIRCEGGVQPHGSLQGKARPAAGGRWFARIMVASELFRKDGVWTRVMRVFDRRRDVYTERISELATGRVRKGAWERLSQHTGHGDDRPARWRKRPRR